MREGKYSFLLHNSYKEKIIMENYFQKFSQETIIGTPLLCRLYKNRLYVSRDHIRNLIKLNNKYKDNFDMEQSTILSLILQSNFFESSILSNLTEQEYIRRIFSSDFFNLKEKNEIFNEFIPVRFDTKECNFILF